MEWTIESQKESLLAILKTAENRLSMRLDQPLHIYWQPQRVCLKSAQQELCRHIHRLHPRIIHKTPFWKARNIYIYISIAPAIGVIGISPYVYIHIYIINTYYASQSKCTKREKERQCNMLRVLYTHTYMGVTSFIGLGAAAAAVHARGDSRRMA